MREVHDPTVGQFAADWIRWAGGRDSGLADPIHHVRNEALSEHERLLAAAVRVLLHLALFS